MGLVSNDWNVLFAMENLNDIEQMRFHKLSMNEPHADGQVANTEETVWIKFVQILVKKL